MKDTYNRFCFLIAASGMRESDVFDLVNEIKDARSDRIMYDVDRIRRLIKSSEFVSDDRGSSSGRRIGYAGVEEKIFSLLIEDARLSRAAAAKLLVEAILSRHLGIDIPMMGKTSFIEWIGRIQKIIPPSELLYLATNIRNSYVHQTKGDWDLR